MTYPWWSLLPFVAMLACIALLPIIPKTSHWWEKETSQLSVALALGVPTTVWLFMKAGNGPLIATGVEYVQFIALLFALFVVSGGIHLAGDIRGDPAQQHDLPGDRRPAGLVHRDDGRGHAADPPTPGDEQGT